MSKIKLTKVLVVYGAKRQFDFTVHLVSPQTLQAIETAMDQSNWARAAQIARHEDKATEPEFVHPAWRHLDGTEFVIYSDEGPV